MQSSETAVIKVFAFTIFLLENLHERLELTNILEIWIYNYSVYIHTVN